MTLTTTLGMKSLLHKTWIVLALLGVGVLSQAQEANLPYEKRPEVITYLKAISESEKIPMDWLLHVVSEAQYSSISERLTTPKPVVGDRLPPEKNFLHYSRRLLSPERLERGLDFMKEHHDALLSAQAKMGVSPWIVSAIIGIETNYGRTMGRTPILNALMTLTFDYPRRAKFYKKELTQFLDYCWREKIDPADIKGSFAGAMGYGQFMPSSLIRYGLDGDNDGHVDLINNPTDAIYSVANFLASHGWQANLPPLLRLKGEQALLEKHHDGGIKPHTRLDLLDGIEVIDADTLSKSEPVLIVDIPWRKGGEPRQTTWYLGTKNFTAILYYNRSYFYATAVSLFAERLRNLYETRGETYLNAPEQPTPQLDLKVSADQSLPKAP